MIKKTWKKALAGLCAAVMMFSSVGPAAIESYAGVVELPENTWIKDLNNDGKEVRLSVRYNGDTTVGNQSGNVYMDGNAASVFDGNDGTGVTFRGVIGGGTSENNVFFVSSLFSGSF